MRRQTERAYWCICLLYTSDIPDKTTIYAQEGSAAHEMAEYKIRWHLGEKDLAPPNIGNFNAEEIDRYTAVSYTHLVSYIKLFT